jgi:uncharacterized glyoxalase superfamily protein PhnB
MDNLASSCNAVQYRVARPTDRLNELVAFYTNGLGFAVIGSFSGHDGYDGVMLGCPGVLFHLEFTQHANGSPCPAPTNDNLLVLYFDTTEKYKAAIARMEGTGCAPVAPENSYWVGKSVTYEDPNGWRVVLFDGVFKAAS